VKEKDFQHELHASFTHFFPDAYYYKIPDASRVDTARPFDAEFLHKGQYWALEFKQMKTLDNMPLSHILDHQLFNLKCVEKNGGKGYFLINYRAPVASKAFYEFIIHEKKINMTFVVAPCVIDLMMGRNMKSIPFMDLWEHTERIEWDKVEYMKSDGTRAEKFLWRVDRLVGGRS
jgi:penicillin-binding protein-related factor A (putative recombinase)